MKNRMARNKPNIERKKTFERMYVWCVCVYIYKVFRLRDEVVSRNVKVEHPNNRNLPPLTHTHTPSIRMFEK